MRPPAVPPVPWAATASASARSGAPPWSRWALGLWRGEDAYADVPGIDCVRERARALQDLRLRALKAYFRARLAVGRPGTVVDGARSLLSRYPLDEELAAVTVVALHRCGRSMAALEVYQQTVQRLREELGVDPGRALSQARREVFVSPVPAAPEGPPPRPGAVRPVAQAAAGMVERWWGYRP